MYKRQDQLSGGGIRSTVGDVLEILQCYIRMTHEIDEFLRIFLVGSLSLIHIYMEALPYKIVDYEESEFWESVYRDRAIIRERIRLRCV